VAALFLVSQYFTLGLADHQPRVLLHHFETVHHFSGEATTEFFEIRPNIVHQRRQIASNLGFPTPRAIGAQLVLHHMKRLEPGQTKPTGLPVAATAVSNIVIVGVDFRVSECVPQGAASGNVNDANVCSIERAAGRGRNSISRQRVLRRTSPHGWKSGGEPRAIDQGSSEESGGTAAGNRRATTAHVTKVSANVIIHVSSQIRQD
jgi:hypothetical protein